MAAIDSNDRNLQREDDMLERTGRMEERAIYGKEAAALQEQITGEATDEMGHSIRLVAGDVHIHQYPEQEKPEPVPVQQQAAAAVQPQPTEQPQPSLLRRVAKVAIPIAAITGGPIGAAAGLGAAWLMKDDPPAVVQPKDTDTVSDLEFDKEPEQ